MASTQVVIIGAGPSGLMLARLLHRNGIHAIVLERQTREYVEARIRAGLLEWTTVQLLNEAGVGERMMREGQVHHGFEISFEGRSHRIDLKGLAGQQMLVYGQTEIQKDLADACLAGGSEIVWEAGDVALRDLTGRHPLVSYTSGGQHHEIECDFIAGCDGFHGVSRASIPKDKISLFERVYPFGWLGVLADVPPVHDELIYASHERGFALCSMRTRTRSRYYVQCTLDDKVEQWSDNRFWDELRARLPAQYAAGVVAGPSIEKSIAPLRSFVAEPMRYGRLFLAGDAAHIVPPTGAKGLNLAAADVGVLYQAFVEYFRSGSEQQLDGYSERALNRVWKATRFSWWLTMLMHRISDEPIARKLQLAELNYLSESQAASRSVAENYAGLPFSSLK